MSSFDPNSSDAMFATIIERLDQQKAASEKQHLENTEVLQEIRDQTTKTNGRVTKLEGEVVLIVNREALRWRYIAGIAFGISTTVGTIWTVAGFIWPLVKPLLARLL